MGDGYEITTQRLKSCAGFIKCEVEGQSLVCTDRKRQACGQRGLLHTVSLSVLSQSLLWRECETTLLQLLQPNATPLLDPLPITRLQNPSFKQLS